MSMLAAPSLTPRPSQIPDLWTSAMLPRNSQQVGASFGTRAQRLGARFQGLGARASTTSIFAAGKRRGFSAKGEKKRASPSPETIQHAPQGRQIKQANGRQHLEYSKVKITLRGACFQKDHAHVQEGMAAYPCVPCSNF